MLTDTRGSLLADRSWGAGDVDARMVYLGYMMGFNQDARVSEYTAPAPWQQDHCVRLTVLLFEFIDK